MISKQRPLQGFLIRFLPFSIPKLAYERNFGQAILLLLLFLGCENSDTTPRESGPDLQMSNALQPARLNDPCGKSVFRKGGLFGYIDCNGKEVLEAKWDVAFPFNAEFGYAIVGREGQFGLIGWNGRATIPPMYSWIEDFGEGFFALADTTRKGFAIVSPQGEYLIPFPMNPVYPFENGYAMGNINGKLMLFDVKGKVSAEIPEGRPVKGKPPGMISESRIAINVKGYIGFWKTSGEQITATNYDYAEAFSDGLALVGRGGKFGFIDLDGKEVIPLTFTEAHSFADGVAPVLVEIPGEQPAWKIIDKLGNFVSPAGFAYIDRFQFGVAWAARKAQKTFGLINTQGIGVNLPEYTDIGMVGDAPPFIIEKAGKWGGIDAGGKEQIPFQFDGILPFKKGRAIFKMGEKWGLIRDNGNIIVPAIYKDCADLGNEIYLFTQNIQVQDYLKQDVPVSEGSVFFFDRDGRLVYPKP